MRIDVHAHIWPDRIAAAVLDNMTGTFGYPAVGVNTVDGIKSHMRESGVGKSVALGVVERPECFGADFPLADMAQDSQFIESLPVPDADKERILGENFRELVGL